ncbi:MAG: hypothetical protein RL479_2522, partial [Verrucomicrobiota bacterium]
MSSPRDPLSPTDTFARRHHGEEGDDTRAMLELLGQPSLEALADAAVPAAIRREPLRLPEP